MLIRFYLKLALESVWVVTQALSQLESGSLGVLSFGDSVQVLHPLQSVQTTASLASAFDSTLNGSGWLQQFTFAQRNTKIALV